MMNDDDDDDDDGYYGTSTWTRMRSAEWFYFNDLEWPL